MIRQISVFVENQPGSMMNVTNVLTEAHQALFLSQQPARFQADLL